MKTIKGLFIGLGLFALPLIIHAQLSLQSLGGAQSDSIVAVTAEAYGLAQIAPADLPPYGTYFEMLPGGVMAPLPCPPLDLTRPIYAITDNILLVDATGGQSAASPRLSAQRMMGSSTESVSSAVAAQGNAIASLIEQVQGAQMDREMSSLFGMDAPTPGGGGDGGGGDTGSYSSSTFSIDTNGLWLEITNVSNGWTYLNLHNGTNQVYAIESAADLTAGWQVETELWPALDQTNVLPFTIPTLNRQYLFVRAQDWTGVTHGGNTTPDWWFWKYFHTTNRFDGELDTIGNSLSYDYLRGRDPNIIQFLLRTANPYVNTSFASVQADVQGGTPVYMTTTESGSLPTNTAWSAYGSSNIMVSFVPVAGPHEIWVGLKGFPAEATVSWQNLILNFDATPPQMVITNPAAGTVAGPVVQIQGWANENLSRLTLSVSNSAGADTSALAAIVSQFYDTNLLKTTTNYFQGYDVALANGLNVITVQATDLAGNVTTTNLSITLDYAGDTQPPALTVLWPPDGALVSGSSFTLQAQVDDPLAGVSAMIVDAAGNTNTVLGAVQRNGVVWVPNLPLAAGTNQVTLTARDAAGNTATTRVSVVKSAVGVTVDPLGDLFNQPEITVTGTVSDPTATVTVNGVAATVNADGTWEADGVPVNPDGTSHLDVEVADAGNHPVAATTLGQLEPVEVVPTAYEYKYTSELDPQGNASGDWGLDDYHLPLHGQYQYRETRDSEGSRQNGAVVFYRSGHVRTRVALALGDAGGAGESRLCLVMAKAKEPPEYQPGTIQPLPPAWLQINGQALVNSGVTNADGTVWGETVLKVPAGVGLYDVTPVATQVLNNWWQYFFDVQASEVNLQLAVDANRDGDIAFDQPDTQTGPDQTTQDKPVRFWVNNDYDGYDNAIDDYDDLDPSTDPAGSDANDTSISCTRDLEDHTRLWLNTQGITTELQNGNLLLALEWKNVTGNPSIRIFPAVETNSGGTLYLTDEATAQAQLNAPYYQCLVDSHAGQDKIQGSLPFIIPTNFWANANVSADQPVAHLLFDAVSRGSGQLVVSIYKNDGVTKVAESPQPLYLKLQDVKEMYERYTVGEDPSSAPATTASVVTSPYSYDSSIPA
ncbi:MAG TPA: hypothetical protein VGI63_04395, partial [Verrucomicrobiae bacterium]